MTRSGTRGGNRGGAPKKGAGRAGSYSGKAGRDKSRRGKGSTGKGSARAAPPEVPVPREGQYLYVLEVPYELRQWASREGASYEKALGMWTYLGNQGSLPKSLEEFRAERFSWGAFRERRLNRSTVGDIPAQDGAPAEPMKPREHQEVAAGAVCEAGDAGLPGFLLADEVGLGKTLSALEGAMRQEALSGGGCLLIVCPNSVVAHWRETLADQSAILAEAGVEAVVVNYERLKKLLAEPASARAAKRTKTKNDRHAKEGRPIEDFDVVIADEAHRTRNPVSQTSRAFRNLADGSFTIWASATAGQNPLELSYLAPLLARLTGQKVSDLADFEGWCAAQGIGVRRGAFGKWEWDGDEDDIEFVHGLLFGHDNPGAPGVAAGIRRLPTDIAGWPEIQRVPMPVSLTREERGLYEKAWAEFRRELEMSHSGKRDSPNPAVVHLRFRQKSSLIRTRATVEMALDTIEAGRLPAISCEFLESLQAVSAGLEQAGVEVATIHGGRTGADKEAARQDFQRGRAGAAVFTVTEGISLHQGQYPGGEKPRATLVHDARRSAIYASQVEGRAHRDGQSSVAYYLYGERTVEEGIIKRLVERMRRMKGMVGDDTATIRELERMLEERA